MMKKFTFLKDKNFYRSVAYYTLPFFFPMIAPLGGIKSAAFAALFFGFFMALIMPVPFHKEPSSENQNSAFFVSQPRKFILYFFLTIAVLCLMITGLMVIFSATQSAVLIMLAISLFALALPYYYSTQTIITESKIIQRRRIFNYSSEKIFFLRNLKSQDINLMGLKLSFSDGISTYIYMYGRLDNLPAYVGTVKNLNLIPLYQLKQEIERRQSLKKEDDLSSEKTFLSTLKPFYVSYKDATITTLVVILLSTGLMYTEHKSSAKRLASFSDKKEIRQENVHRAFRFFKDTTYYSLKKEWEDKCKNQNDYNCRLFYYMDNINGDKKEHIALLNSPCQNQDPQSCYIIFTNALSSISEKEIAENVLKQECRKSENSNLTCCTCYAQAKSNQRSISSH